MTTFVRAQLAIFAVLTVIGLVLMAGMYVQLPAMFGIGRYEVTLRLAATGGLYEHSNVSYRGSTVGTVTDVRLTPEGVDATLSLESKRKIPDDVRAAVRSVSAIGEQFVDLVPEAKGGGGDLVDGDVIPVERTTLPQDVGPLLDRADKTLAALGHTQLRTVVDEAFLGFNGAGPDLQRFLDSTLLFLQEAEKNTVPTTQLLEQLGPLLDTQRNNPGAVRAWTGNLARFTDSLREHDPQLRQVLTKAPGAVDEATQMFSDLKPTLPMLLANMVSVGQVSVTYLPGIEQILVIFPPLVRSLAAAAGGGPPGDGAMTDFMVQFQNPPPCTTGFLPPSQWRSPALLDAPPTPNNLFCKVPQDSPIGVRGIRNFPCMEVPGKRAPTPEACRSPEPFKPEGLNLPLSPHPLQQPAHPPPPTARPYDPSTGKFMGNDGITYRQPEVAKGGASAPATDWKSMMMRQQGR